MSEASPRVIGPLGGFAIVAGSMLGIGIFLSPPIVAKYVAEPLPFLLVWVAGGLTALAGAVACGELGTLFPRAGGDYVFQYEAYGQSVAFASGWTLFAAIFCGSIATMSVGLCTYQLPTLLGIDLAAYALPLPGGAMLDGTRLAAIVLVVALTLLNVRGARPSAGTQAALTLVPIGALVVFSLWALLRGGAPPPVEAAAVPALTLGGIVLAYNAVYFAYSGWINVIYVGGEVREPQRNIPRSLVLGTLAVTALYLLLCIGFLRVLGPAGVADAGEVGSATAGVLGGPGLRLALTVLIASALVASINGTVLGGARVAQAMAERGALWSRLAALDPERKTPRRALWLQAALSILLVASGQFEELLHLVSLTMVLTGTLTVGCLFVLRRTRPKTHRPYRATGYPWLPGLYVVSSLVVIGIMLQRAVVGEPGAWYPLLGLAIFAAAYLGHRTVAGPSRPA
ncbi:MAG: amino acid permease [Myxococcota bacterium]|nr:amino acid permease [Myxococcota bacterium]